MSDTSGDEAGLSRALASAQAELVNPELDGLNPHFDSRFATLGSCLRSVRPVLGRHGVAIVQQPSWADGILTVETVLLHGAERLSSSLACACPGSPQKIGAAITYLRRYALCAMVGIVGDDDDDGNAAQDGADQEADRHAEDKAAVGDLLRSMGAGSRVAAKSLITAASEGSLSLADVDSRPGEVLAELREYEKHGAPRGLGGGDT